MDKLIDLRKKHDPPLQASQPADPVSRSPNIIEQKIAWHGPLYNHRPDMPAVWTVVIIFWVVAGLYQYYQSNIITTIFFGLLGLMILLHAKKKPVDGSINLSPLGIQINEKTYRFKDIKSFWVDFQPKFGINELSLQIRHWYLPYLKIPLLGQNPVQIRSFLLQFLPEVEHEETLADTLARRLGL